MGKLCKALFGCKTLRKGIEYGVEGAGVVKFWDHFFQKSGLFYKTVPFLANIERCPKFLEYDMV